MSKTTEQAGQQREVSEIHYEEFRYYGGQIWLKVSSPDVRDYDWYLHIRPGAYDVEYASAVDGNDARTFSHEPASPDEQALVDNADPTTVIRWAHADIMSRVEQEDAAREVETDRRADKIIEDFRGAVENNHGYDNDLTGLKGFIDGGWQEHEQQCKESDVDPYEVVDRALNRMMA